MADSLLFRALGINYIKITPEDIEAWTMTFKLGMPVHLSSYPNSKSYSAFETHFMPESTTQTFRWKAFKDSIRMRWARYKYLNKIRAELPYNLRQPLLDSYDQDHAMIIAEGTNAGLIQSIMMKPPNIKPVYPLRKE